MPLQAYFSQGNLSSSAWFISQDDALTTITFTYGFSQITRKAHLAFS
jgi:hypothetical protein